MRGRQSWSSPGTRLLRVSPGAEAIREISIIQPRRLALSKKPANHRLDKMEHAPGRFRPQRIRESKVNFGERRADVPLGMWHAIGSLNPELTLLAGKRVKIRQDGG